jgi:hypothetical protein
MGVSAGGSWPQFELGGGTARSAGESRTSSERNDIEPVLRKADIHECFRAMVFGGDADQHEPDPEPYRKIRERLGIQTAIAFKD